MMTRQELDAQLTRGGTHAALYGLRCIEDGAKIAAMFAAYMARLASDAWQKGRHGFPPSIEYAVESAFECADHQATEARNARNDGSPDAASDCARRAWSATLDACAYVGMPGDVKAQALLHTLLREVKPVGSFIDTTNIDGPSADPYGY